MTTIPLQRGVVRPHGEIESLFHAAGPIRRRRRLNGLASVASACAAGPCRPLPTNNSEPMNTRIKARFPVDGMSCAGCAVRLEKALRALPGVAEANVNFALARASVEYDGDGLRTPDIRDTVVNAGFQTGEYVRSLDIGGMRCNGCAAGLSGTLGRVPGVLTADVNFTLERATITTLDPELGDNILIKTVEAAGFSARAHRTRSTERSAHNGRGEAQPPTRDRERWAVVIAVALTTPLVLQMLTMGIGAGIRLPVFWEWLLATPVQFAIGARFYRGAWYALKNRAGNMDVLVALGTSAAYFYSVYLWSILGPQAGQGRMYFEASAVVITLVVFGKWLESRAKQQATSAIHELMALRPETACLLRDGKEKKVAVAEVRAGDQVLIKPGERVPTDGIIVVGHTEIDESMVTGESMPVSREVGQSVTGGTVNGAGLIRVRTTTVGEDSTLSRIIRLVENAQAGKAPVQRLVDRISAVFVPAVLTVAVVAFLSWWFAGAGLETALIHAVSVLVIACPCALGLATPTAIVAGTGVAARAGILIKDIAALETARRIDTVVFDKTGTLTAGRPAVTDCVSMGSAQTLKVAATLEAGSEHPLAQAIVNYAKAENVVVETPEVLQILPGEGVSGRVHGHNVVVGNHGLLARLDIPLDSIPEIPDTWARQGKTVVLVAVDGQIEIAFGISDPVRSRSAAAIRQLKIKGIRTIMLTGDADTVAREIAGGLDIDEVLSQVKPDGKLAAIQDLRRGGATVAMVGDGINDAPAMAGADVAIAMGTGSDIAMESAGITLMRPDVSLVADAIDLAVATDRKIKQNLFWAFVYNVVGLPLAAFGFLSPAMAGAAMAFSSISVVSNSLLLKRWRARE